MIMGGCINILKILFISVCCVSFAESKTENLLKLFKDYVIKFNKTYQYHDDSRLLSKRFQVFKENLEFYDRINGQADVNGTLVYGINKFSDLTPEEFRKIYLSDLIRHEVYQHKNQKTPLDLIKNLNIPKIVDWAFSTTETVESMYAKVTGQPVPDLSVQEVIDCAAGNYGCAGGDTCTALSWMVNNRTRLVYNKDYPLVDVTQKCHRLSPSLPNVSVLEYSCKNYVGNEQKMLQLLSSVGPLVITVDATTWNSYMGGIIKFHCSNYNNHAVQIVGYDLTGEVPFYIIRNSWGPDFGDKGYLYVKIGDNLCGVAQRVSTVAVDVS
ncbi:cathepsin O-like isoform X2 [Gigantopelta aegis]|uniref:cathepsin O-like isoform X2 n=1 Tax=Gigantopelta aegis TaxID=1735272 RepID=UPI001B88DF68|nr:cathepsin O-like isoform X2 [Gigantopelta aegis]